MKTITYPLKSLLFLIFLLISHTIIGQSIATYDITFTSTWNAMDHSSFPSGAHWSDLAGATHNNNIMLFALGELATTGIKNVAEIGDNGVYEDEVDAAILAGDADQWLRKSFSSEPDAFATLSDVSVSEDFPLLSLASMVAPSPDWFIGINSLNLRNASDDGWKDSFTMDVFAYDAGTDSGTDYTSADQITTPFQPISLISGFPINGNKMGTLTVTLKSVLGTDDFDGLNTVKVFPNPTQGNITISNIENKNVNTVQIYSILGQLASNIDVKSGITSMDINLETLHSGIYLLKINTVEGTSKTQKLIIE